MGRRPNALIAEYYTRGAKIHDQSNRYEQTCKRCGLKFRKGRHEHMIPHLTKACPGIKMVERARIAIRMYDINLQGIDPFIKDDLPGVSNTAGQSTATNAGQNGEIFQGLHVLAGAAEEQGTDTIASASRAPDAPLDPLLASATPTATASFPVGYHYMSNVPATNLDTTMELEDEAYSAAGTSADADANVVTGHDGAIASGQFLLDGMSQDVPQGSQGSFGASSYPLQSSTSTNPAQTALSAFAALAYEQRPLRPIASNSDAPSTTATDTGAALMADPRTPVRSQFTAERRSEVSSMRKIGACLRCKMLRKVCSADTPCKTCSHIESPRVWKVSCSRTKLKDEFPLYVAMPHGVLAQGQYNDWSAEDHVAFNGYVEIWQLPNHSIALEAHQVMSSGDQQHTEPNVFFLNLDSRTVGDQVKQYLEAITDGLIQREHLNPVIKASLEFAQNEKMLRETDTSAPKHDKADNLVSDTISLWVATNMLTDQDLPTMIFVHNQSINERVPLCPDTHPISYGLITNQLLSAVEQRAGELCREVLQHLEGRFLVRKYGVNFETFLMAFIVLNCAERMVWQYRRWMASGVACPLDTDPSSYVEKAETFAQMVEMLSGLRGTTPKLKAEPTSGKLTAVNTADSALVLWLDATGLTTAASPASTTKFSASFGPMEFDPDNHKSLDGTFSSRLLQEG
jgi:hypothetical protein